MASADNPAADGRDRLDFGLAQIARRQLNVVFLLDCSGSMRGEKIASLNYAIRSALPELSDVARDNPEVSVVLSAVCFSSTASWHIEKPSPVTDIEWVDVKAGGETALGAALEMVAAQLRAQSEQARLLPPVLVLVSDGYPTDDVNTGFRVFFAEKVAAAATRISIAIGDNVDMGILEQFMDAPGSHLRPLQANSAPDLVRHIKWATTVPVKSISAPVLAPDPAEQLARAVDQQNRVNSKLIW